MKPNKPHDPVETTFLVLLIVLSFASVLSCRKVVVVGPVSSFTGKSAVVNLAPQGVTPPVYVTNPVEAVVVPPGPPRTNHPVFSWSCQTSNTIVTGFFLERSTNPFGPWLIALFVPDNQVGTNYLATDSVCADQMFYRLDLKITN